MKVERYLGCYVSDSRRYHTQLLSQSEANKTWKTKKYFYLHHSETDHDPSDGGATFFVIIILIYHLSSTIHTLIHTYIYIYIVIYTHLPLTLFPLHHHLYPYIHIHIKYYIFWVGLSSCACTKQSFQYICWMARVSSLGFGLGTKQPHHHHAN